MSQSTGTFCWADLTTTDMGSTIEFYGSLFGWQTVEAHSEDQHYIFFTKDGKHVGGAGLLTQEMVDNGAPTVWTSYIATDNADETVKKVEALGGKVIMPPAKIGDSGRVAMIAEPTGAIVGLWEADGHKGFDAFQEEHAACWFELATREPQTSLTFFKELLGWEGKTEEMPHTSYTTLMLGDKDFGGIIQMNEQWGEMPAHWMVYFDVKDIKASCKKVEELGGKICVPITDIGVGSFSVINDPNGSTFTLFQGKS